MRIQPQRESGFSLLEILAVVAIILIIAAIGIPQIVGVREKAKNRACEHLFYALDDEMANALDNLIWSSTEVISLVLRGHTEEENPRNRRQYAFVTDDEGIDLGDRPPQFLEGGEAKSCQVLYSSAGPLSILVRQAASVGDEEGAERSYRVSLAD